MSKHEYALTWNTTVDERYDAIKNKQLATVFDDAAVIIESVEGGCSFGLPPDALAADNTLHVTGAPVDVSTLADAIHFITGRKVAINER